MSHRLAPERRWLKCDGFVTVSVLFKRNPILWVGKTRFRKVILWIVWIGERMNKMLSERCSRSIVRWRLPDIAAGSRTGGTCRRFPLDMIMCCIGRCNCVFADALRVRPRVNKMILNTQAGESYSVVDFSLGSGMVWSWLVLPCLVLASPVVRMALFCFAS